MRVLSFFIFHILSFLPFHPNSIEKVNHILISDIKKPIEKKNLEKIYPIDTLLYFHTHPIKKRDDCIDIYLPKVFQENKLKVESFKTSTYHYQQFIKHRFSKHLSYEDYCKLEKQLSKIIEQYLKDNKNHYGIIVDDIFLEHNGIKKYWDFKKNYFLIRSSVNDKLNKPDYIILEKIKDYSFI